VYTKVNDSFKFKNTFEHLIFNTFEGQIDTGNMMQALLKKAAFHDILILNNQNVSDYQETNDSLEVVTNEVTFKTKKLIFTTNGFASELTKNEVKPARAQVLITKPIENLHIKGTFHLDQGYYYFRNINNRVLFGGGRNLDFEAETTTSLATTEKIQNRLQDLLKNVILPDTPFEIEHSWSGIMGIGNSKNPIVQQLSNHVYCGVRMGGMGVAIGSLIGKEVADLI
jgi:glycine/D-amino acid oxidase-like deaminating enzyme